MKILKTVIAASLTACTLSPAALLAGDPMIAMDISQQDKPATIKVLVAELQDKLFLEAKGRYRIYNPFSEVLLASGNSTERHWMTAEKNGLQWGDLFPGIYHIRIVPADAISSTIVNGIEYKGCVEIYHVHGKFHVINEVDIERFLKSTLTAYFPTELDEEVMDAVVIAARTNAYYLATKKKDAFWDVRAHDVGYQGHAVTLQNIHVDRAINTTRHMVMTYNGKPFPTSWTKDSAGKTADFAAIFRKNVEAPKGVEAPFAARDREKNAWTFTISKQDLAKALGAARVQSFDVYQDGKTQKIYGARVSNGSDVRQIDFGRLQKALGAVRLKSNDFTVATSGDKLVFKGHGEGNGVGLCLYSASAMADKGEKAPKILASFYPETNLEKMRSFHSEEEQANEDVR